MGEYRLSYGAAMEEHRRMQHGKAKDGLRDQRRKGGKWGIEPDAEWRQDQRKNAT